jgi:4-hydroxy-4-methyl-2-oxoglutarate aldolase
MKNKILSVDFPRPSPEVIRRYLAIEDLTSTVSDLLDEFGVVGAIPASVLMPVVAGKRIAGPAVTIRHIPENKTHSQLMFEKSPVHWALKEARDAAKPGDVIVYDGNGRADLSSAGHLAVVFSQKKGLAGLVIDCGVRDVDAIRKLDYPTWSRGVTPITGKYRFETVEINGPIVCAGVSVRPGDLILADGTGVVIVPFDYIEKVLHAAEEAVNNEQELIKAIDRGVEGEELTKILPVNKW